MNIIGFIFALIGFAGTLFAVFCFGIYCCCKAFEDASFRNQKFKIGNHYYMLKVVDEP